MASRDSYCDFNLNGGKLFGTGFEEVNSLPTTNLFAGRQVTYNGQVYVYNGSTWVSWYNPVPTFVEPYPYTMTTEELTHGATAIGGIVGIQLLNSISSSLLSVIDDVSGDNYLIETNDGSGWSVVSGSVSSYRRIPVGSSIRYTAFKDMNQSPAGLGYFFAVYKDGNYRLNTTSRYDIEFYFPNDKGVSHWKTVYIQQFDSDEGSYWFFPVQKYWRLGTNSNQEITNARITITTMSSTDASYPETVVSNIKFLTNRQLTSKTTPVYINYDAVIKPTQSTETYKTIAWVLQYLTQGVNWLMANHLPLSGGTLSGDIKAPQFIVPNGTAAQFLKADGSLDSNSYALHTDLNAAKNNAWKLDIANPECETVVITLQQGQGIFEAMAKAGIDYSKSRNIYVDLSEISSIGGGNIIDNLFSGYENLPVGVRYHIFFGNVQSSVKIYWLKPIESNIPYRVVGLTSDYPTAKCEFLRVTTDWAYADWEAAINQVDFSLDTGTASESDNSTLVNYMDNNKVSYTKTTKGALVNITALLAALASSK